MLYSNFDALTASNKDASALSQTSSSPTLTSGRSAYFSITLLNPKSLYISKINTGGIPDHKKRTLILDINFNEKYFERVIHHEISHIIQDSFKLIFNETTWSEFNDKSFKYAECSTCTKKIGLETYSNPNGFITEYSQSTASEDMAEVFSHLMYGNLPNKIDPILEKKIKFIKNALSKIDNDFIL